MDAHTTAEFVERSACISCQDKRLTELSSGRFDEGLVKEFIEQDPWGEHPAPFLRGKPWSFVRCENCSLTFHRYILSPEWNERRFSRWMTQEAIAAFEARLKTPTYEFEQASHHVEHVLRIARLTRSIRGSDATRVLDFGCGYGGFLYMCSMFGFQAFGVDRSSAKREYGRFPGIFAEIEEVADKGPFHALTLFQVLEHLDDPHALMARLRGLLAEGAILVLETPDCSGVSDIRNRQDYYKIHPLEHINGFTAATMKDFAARLGFEAIKRPIGSVTSDPKKALGKVGKWGLGSVLKPTTELYFRKT